MTFNNHSNHNLLKNHEFGCIKLLLKDFQENSYENLKHTWYLKYSKCSLWKLLYQNQNLHQGRSTLNQDITQNQHPRNLALKVHVYFENVHDVNIKSPPPLPPPPSPRFWVPTRLLLQNFKFI
jgi:hypothetical protein